MSENLAQMSRYRYFAGDPDEMLSVSRSVRFCLSDIARHSPVGARGEGNRDFRAVGDAVALVLSRAKTSDELGERVIDFFARMFAGKCNPRQFAQLAL